MYDIWSLLEIFIVVKIAYLWSATLLLNKNMHIIKILLLLTRAHARLHNPKTNHLKLVKIGPLFQLVALQGRANLALKYHFSSATITEITSIDVTDIIVNIVTNSFRYKKRSIQIFIDEI